MPIRPDMRPRYPADWKAISLSIRRDRAHWQCERCGVKNGGRNPETGSVVILTTAHLNHTPEDCRPENLQALCQLCHNRHDMLHRQRGRRERERIAAGVRAMPFDTYGLCVLCGEVCDQREPCPCCGAAPGRPQ